MTAAAGIIAARVRGFHPRIGLMLGSGLGEIADTLEDRTEIPYRALPDFHVGGGPAGHRGALVLGRLAGQDVAVFAGRWHVYEGIEAAAITTPIRTLQALGAEALILTNAAGSLREETGPGALVAITDHINLLGFNPLTGSSDAAGPRFVSLAGAYDAELRTCLHAAAAALEIPLGDGVYLAVAGPSFETPAEIRAFRTLGADLVGMSTVPEVIAARHAGLRVAAISAVTNLAEGMGGEPLSHDQTLRVAKAGAAKLEPLLRRFLEDL